MKFSTETLAQITELLVMELERQLIEGEQVTFAELEQEMRKTLQEVGKTSIGQMLTLKDEEAHGVVLRCTCGWQGKRVSRRAAKLLSVFGWLSYRRSYYQCAACGQRWHPLDEHEGLRPGRATPGMVRLLGIAGVTVSFEEACHQIGEYLLVEVSVNTLRTETQRLGELQAQRESKWIANSQDLAYLQARERLPTQPQCIYGSIDGAFVPLEQGWKEEKTISWYRAGHRYGSSEQRAVDIHYYTSLEEAQAFGELVWATGVHHQVDKAKETVFVCDGATWIWNLVEHYFPEAIQIVDWYHACQYLYPVAEALFGTENPTAQDWIQEMKDLLWEGDVAAVISICQSLLNDTQAGKPAQSAVTYYTNNQHRMNYAYFRNQGYFIGSGTVESACKQIVSLRLKRSGARWTPAGASSVAKARAAWLSHQWDDLTILPLAV